MQNLFKKTDIFTKNTIVVFIGTFFVNFFNLAYQLFIAHKFSPADFAAFNSLLSLFTIFAFPLSTLQMGITKYAAEFSAHNQIQKIKFLLSDLFKKTSILALASLLIFLVAANFIINALKIPSLSSGYILALLVSSTWILAVFSGGIQGLEQFFWFSGVSILGSILKLSFAFILIFLGYGISGALGALLSANLISIAIYYFVLKDFISFKAAKEHINYREILIYLLPVAASFLCFIALVNFDMVLVKYYFPVQSSGFYSLAQMVGKIFLFLPGAISIAMFPRTSSLRAKEMDTSSILKRSLLYVSSLCIFACIIYNLFPAFVLKVLTGKIYPEAVLLGRLFGISMSFFSLALLLITYFLSVKDLRFLKYLIVSCLCQNLAILLLHNSLVQVQFILCINSALIFFTLLFFAYKK
ncbi:MAG: oligosaccharide flippase family protein [Candidatus Omnitrophica bacterium]|nr:oligosaccharide flippase family protein [Candidatus Omnitrophota bacterium]